MLTASGVNSLSGIRAEIHGFGTQKLGAGAGSWEWELCNILSLPRRSKPEDFDGNKSKVNM